MDIDFIKRSEQLKALGHPIRLRIVSGLLQDRCNVSNIVDKLNLPQSTISQHLGVLRSCGILVAEKEGVKTCYRVIDEKIEQILWLLSG